MAMTDITAAPEDRYEVRGACHVHWVYDRVLEATASKYFSLLSAAYDECQRLNREARTANKLVAEPAAPADRYVVADHGVTGCYVIDSQTGLLIGRPGLTRATAFREARRLNREARAVIKPAAAPEDRYVVTSIKRHQQYGGTTYAVLDRDMGERRVSGLSTWAFAHSEAQRLNREARAANKPAAEQPAPCRDCAAKLRAAEEKAERYRHALAQIWRYCSGTARRYAERALFADVREKGE